MLQLTQFTTTIRSNLIIQEYKNWLRKGDTVLDIGCGDGIMSSILKKKLGIHVRGCDIDNYLKVTIPFKLMSSYDSLPFTKNSFDAVMLNDVLHHMSFENQSKIIREALRVAPKILIFEVEPTVFGATADYIINKFHNISMKVPLTFRKHNEWISLFKTLNTSYKFKSIKKPLLYPFTHEAFLISIK